MRVLSKQKSANKFANGLANTYKKWIKNIADMSPSNIDLII
ncbi:hypothetical protein P4V63_28160 [Bacillus toyonensis]|nr:hypothetical protein [Bacillus toyonensis]MEE2021756.1 hypothetical protein [Bacillus toyonensis]